MDDGHGPLFLVPVLTPHGRLTLHEASDGPTLDSGLAERLQRTFARGSGYGLLQLGAGEVGTALPPVLSYWREIGTRYVTPLCTLPDAEEHGATVHARAPPQGGNADTCGHAKCLDEEISTGRALEVNSLTLNHEEGSVRLNWNPPYLNDGTGLPIRYNVCRRVQGSLSPFARIGETTSPTFLDTTSGSDVLEYEIAAVMK